MIKLLIFDLDGTLADTSRDITEAINFAVKPLGSREYSVEETKAMVGSGISKLLETLTDAALKGSDLHSRENIRVAVINRFIEYYAGHLLDNTVAYPHVNETLKQLTAYKKAVVSNKREVYSKEVLEGLGLLQYFDRVLGSDSVPEKKPSPVPMLMLLKEFNATKDEALVIGDSNYDIEAAKAAGIRVVAVTYGFRNRGQLKDADWLINSFKELPGILNETGS